MKIDHHIYWKYPEKVVQLIELYSGERCSIIDRLCDDQYTKNHLRADLVKAMSRVELDQCLDAEDCVFSKIYWCCIRPRAEFNLLEGLEESFSQQPNRIAAFNIIRLSSGTETRLWQDEDFRNIYKSSGLRFGWAVIPDDQLRHFGEEIAVYLEKGKTESFREKNGIDTMSMAERVDFMWQLDGGQRKYRRTLGKDGAMEDFSEQDITDIYLTMKAKKSENPERYRLFTNIFLHDVDIRVRKLGARLLNESPGAHGSLI